MNDEGVFFRHARSIARKARALACFWATVKHVPELAQEDRTALLSWGLDPNTERAFLGYEGFGAWLGRISSVHYGGLFVELARGRVLARPSGKSALRAQLLVGDWVVLAIDERGTATIHALLPRVNELVRLGSDQKVQAMLSNVSTVALVFSSDMELAHVKPQEFQALAESSNLGFMIVLTKPDLVPADTRTAELRTAGYQCAVTVVNGITGDGMDALEAQMLPQTVTAFMGASGVGKSSILNHLLGRAAQSVGDTRVSDGKGRHTTTHRELFRTASGALVVDTPGMRVFRASTRQERG
jgi:ribosome biogenesis GTPase / thiamine phosphate phosphatase